MDLKNVQNEQSLRDLRDDNKRPVHATTWMKLQRIMLNKNKDEKQRTATQS